MSTRIELVHENHVSRVRFRSDSGIQLFSSSVRRELAGVLDELESRESLRIVVFEAEGRTFIAGADIKELADLAAESAEEMALASQQLFRRIDKLSAVTLAAIHAACAGGGFELALACDLRMAASSAKIGLPETTLGVIPGWGGTVRVCRLFGAAVARRLILCGELLSANEAHRLGIVDSVTADDGFRDAVDERIALLLKRGPNACHTAKSLIAAFEGPDLNEQLRAEARAFAECYRSPEAREGFAAFLEKRPPQW